MFSFMHLRFSPLLLLLIGAVACGGGAGETPATNSPGTAGAGGTGAAGGSAPAGGAGLAGSGLTAGSAGAAAGTSAGTAGGGGGAAGVAGGSGAGSMPSATGVVSFPFLVAQGAQLYFPTYLGHLLGGKAVPEYACVDLDTPVALTVEISAELVGYSQEVKKTLSVPAGKSKQCLSPVPDASKLYALASPTAGVAQARATAGGKVIAEKTQSVTVLPVQSAFSGGLPGAPPALPKVDLHAVFSTPNNPAVQTFYTQVANKSRWGGFGAGGYEMFKKSFTKPVTFTNQAGGWQAEAVYFTAGESILLSLDAVSCSLCSPPNSVDVRLYTAKQWQSFDSCSPPTATVTKLGAQAGTLTVTAPSEGWYVLVLANPCGLSTGQTVTYRRTGTTVDAPLEVMRATFDTLKAKGVQYVTVASNFFAPEASQTIRLPETSLADTAANCIDGSMLFASILEKAELEPVVTYVSGHAFVGARQAPGDPSVWSVETTMVGTSDFDSALDVGLAEYMNKPHLFDLVVKKARLAGVTPIPK